MLATVATGTLDNLGINIDVLATLALGVLVLDSATIIIECAIFGLIEEGEAVSLNDRLGSGEGFHRPMEEYGETKEKG